MAEISGRDPSIDRVELRAEGIYLGLGRPPVDESWGRGGGGEELTGLLVARHMGARGADDATWEGESNR